MTKLELEFKELELTVKELELKVSNLERPFYKQPTFWTTIITVAIAVVGVIGQSYLSSIKNAQAKLETEIAKKEQREAEEKKIMTTAELQKLEKKRDIVKQQLDSALTAYTKLLAAQAYTDSDPAIAASLSSQNTKKMVTQTTSNIENLLNENVNDALLKSSRVTVYYVPDKKTKAIAIDSLLKGNGVKSKSAIPDYDISKVLYNEIVYYNEPQLIYCKAVQKILEQHGYGTFNIRLSSGKNATFKNFKLYVVR